MRTVVGTVLAINITSAHPGRTASDGCHYCRTNCASWGEVYGARHCHGGGSYRHRPHTYTRYRPVTCSTGYCKYNNRCIYKPANAYCVSGDPRNARLCHSGYVEKGNRCIKETAICTANAIYSNDQCYCKQGYCPYNAGGKCVKRPQHATCAETRTSARRCNAGYREKNNQCVPQEIQCPPYSKKTGPRKCTCNKGYCVYDNRLCVKKPAHAYCVNNSTDAWLCNSGYREVGNACIAR